MTSLTDEDRERVVRLLEVAMAATRDPERVGPTQHQADMELLRKALYEDGPHLAALLSAARDEGRAEGLGGEWNSINRVPLPIGREVIVGKWFARPDGNVIWDQEIYTAYDAGWRAEWGDDKPTHWTDTPAPPASQTQEG